MSSRARSGAVAVLILFVAACSRGGPARLSGPPARHLLLVTLDTTRADRIGCYGRAAAGTSWIDALAARGLRAGRAYAQAPLTLPSHTAIMTGLLPVHSGVHMNGDTSLSPGVRTLAEILSERGWFTAAAVGGYPLSRRFPVSRGFAEYDDQMADPRNPEGLERDAGQVVAAALRVLEHRGGRQTFLWVHLFDPHDPYAPLSPWKERYASDPYQGEIARVDAALAELEAGVSRALGGEPLLIAVTGDHGEALGEHGEETHGYFLYEATVRIPMILAGARVPAGVVLEDPAQTTDLLPTLLALLDQPAPAGSGLDGRDLLAPDAAAGAQPVFLETELPLRNYGWSPLHGIVEDTTKAIEAPVGELYDLAADPAEARNLAPAQPSRFSGLRDEIAAVRAGAGEHIGGATADPMIASLGYASSGGPRSGGPLADPKDRVETYRRFQQAAMLLSAGRPAEALPILDALAAQENTPGLHFRRATALRMLGRLPEASLELDAVAASQPDFPGLHMERTRIAIAPPNPDPRLALSEVEKHLAQAPRDAGALMFRGAAKEMLGDALGAESDYRSALALNPAFGGAALRLAALLVRAGRIPEARVVLQDRLAQDPSDTLASGLLGSLPG